jgi:capsular exopolysaccharide synthesis family protein
MALKQLNPGAATDDVSSNVVAFLKALRKNWPVILGSILLAAGAALLYSKSLPRVYQAVAMVEFDPHAIRPLSEKETQNFSSYWDNREYYETQYKVITSDNVLTKVVRDLGLQTDPDFVGVRKPGDPPVPVEDLAASLRARTSVEPVKGSRLVLVKVEDTSPKRARRLCEGLVTSYIAQNLEKSVSATSEAVVWLNGQVDHFKSELESNENALHAFKAQNALPSTSINEASNMVRAEMAAFNDALTKTLTRKQELLARAAELAKLSPETPELVPASELLSNAFLQSLRAAYLQAVKDRAELIAEGKGENHPSMKKADEKVAQAKTALMNEIKNVQGALERDLAIIQRQQMGEAALFEGARKRAVELHLKEIEYNRLDRARQQNERLYGLLLDRMKEADLARMMNVNNVRLVDPPLEPKRPIRPNVPVNVGVGLLMGLVVGLAFAGLREMLDSSIKTPADVEEKLGVTFLGLLPTVEDDAAPRPGRSTRPRRKNSRTASVPGEMPPELIIHERPLSGIAEMARTIRTNLLFLNPDKPFRRLLVSSAAPSEGKTTVACTIAIALAQGGQRVCIVDCDLRRPRIHRIFDRVGDFGVTNVLVGDATIDDVAKPTRVENLWSIPSGPTPPNAADVLHSERFKKFLDELGEKFDRVVIDSPPLIAVTDAAIISTLVDGTVFVLRAFRTAKALSRQGLRALADVDARVLGAVLNAVDLRKQEYGYYQQYYRYKAEGYAPLPPSDPDDDSSAPPTGTITTAASPN